MAASFVAPSWAHAESTSWVVIPASTDEQTAWMQPTAEGVSSALGHAGVDVIPPEQAAAAFEQRGSASSTRVSDSDIDRWVTQSREAIRHLARADYQAALDALKEAQITSRRAIDELNREKHRSQNVLDTCLYLVRALLETGNRSRARTQTQECVRLVPQGEPNPHMHPPAVVALYEKAAKAGPERTGALTVDSAPSGCPVRINGLRFGQTPFEMAGLYQGQYQVQVECDPNERGRVHPVAVGSERATLFVDTEFDEVVRTEPTLGLRYSTDVEASRLASDARHVLEVLDHRTGVLATVPTRGILELQRVGDGRSRGGLVRIPTTAKGPSTKDAARAAAVLKAGECADLTGPKPVPVDCKESEGRATDVSNPQADWPQDRPPRGQWISGLTLAGLGGASLIVGYSLHITRGRIDLIEGNNPSAEERWLNLRNYLVTTAAIGGAAATTAMPLVLPYRSKTPWWAWMSGGIGVGFAIGSIVTALTLDGTKQDASTPCFERPGTVIPQVCLDRGQQTDRAILFGMTAAPLLTMPLVYLFRRADKRGEARFTPKLTASRQGARFTLSGHF
ncbi:MAG: PEGA domain-containing protein [Myxococcota bacterium]